MQWPPDPVTVADWKGRGITPIPYPHDDNHAALTQVLRRWSKLSGINGKPDQINRELRRIVRQSRSVATEADRDLFDHLVRRSSSGERVRIAEAVSKAGAAFDWVEPIFRNHTWTIAGGAMMRPRWIELSDHERHTYRAAVAFLAGRLEQRESIEWALGLHPGRRAERIAVLDTLNGTRDTDLSEPGDQLGGGSKKAGTAELSRVRTSDGAYAIRDRIIQGDRSAALVSESVHLSPPSVKARLLSKVRLSLGRPPHRPRSVGH